MNYKKVFDHVYHVVYVNRTVLHISCITEQHSVTMTDDNSNEESNSPPSSSSLLSVSL